MLARAVGGIADEGPMAGYSDCPRKKKLKLFVREHSLVNRSGKGGIADEIPMVGYSDCPRKKNYNYSSGRNHLLARAVGGKSR